MESRGELLATEVSCAVVKRRGYQHEVLPSVHFTKKKKKQGGCLKRQRGVWVENPRQVRKLINEHFIKLFTSEGSRE